MSTGIPYLDEMWMEVPGYAGYLVSNLGRIKGPGKNHYGNNPMNPMKTKDGYLFILTRRHSMPRKLFIHRAVLTAFVGPCPPNCESMHTPDPDPGNNKLENLKWGTRIEQRADEIARGLKRGEKSGTHKLTEKDVIEIRRLRPFSTARELAKKYGVSHTTILAAANGEHWSHI